METYLLVGSELLSSMSPVAIPPQSLGGKLSWMNPVTNLEKIERYLGSIEDGNFAYIADLFSPYAVIEQLPNRIRHQDRSCYDGRLLREGAEAAVQQSYEIKNRLVELAIAFGSLSAGSEMRAHSAMFFEFKDGKIVTQRSYDCFEPW
jgi:hypothetical protein